MWLPASKLRIKEEKHRIISTDKRKSTCQNLWLLIKKKKTIRKLGLEGNFLNCDKGHLQNAHSWHHQWEETEFLPPKIGYETEDLSWKPPTTIRNEKEIEVINITVVHLHNGILRSRKEEGTPALCNSMDGTGEHYAKWNKPSGERQIHMISPISGT